MVTNAWLFDADAGCPPCRVPSRCASTRTRSAWKCSTPSTSWRLSSGSWTPKCCTLPTPSRSSRTLISSNQPTRSTLQWFIARGLAAFCIASDIIDVRLLLACVERMCERLWKPSDGTSLNSFLYLIVLFIMPAHCPGLGNCIESRLPIYGTCVRFSSPLLLLVLIYNLMKHKWIKNGAPKIYKNES